MNITDIDTSDLTDDGDLLELGGPENLRLRLRIEPDDISVNDMIGETPNVMVYGAVSKYCYDYHHDGNVPRPDNFTGRARKLQVDRGYWLWWEPFNYEGEWDRKSPEEQRQEADWIRDLCERGFLSVGLYLEEWVTDFTGAGHWVEVDAAWIGGVDEFYPELIHDLASELPDLEVNAHG